MKKWKAFAPGALVAALGAAAMLYGIYRSEVEIILRKAIFVCLECIGIG